MVGHLVETSKELQNLNKKTSKILLQDESSGLQSTFYGLTDFRKFYGIFTFFKLNFLMKQKNDFLSLAEIISRYMFWLKLSISQNQKLDSAHASSFAAIFKNAPSLDP